MDEVCQTGDLGILVRSGGLSLRRELSFKLLFPGEPVECFLFFPESLEDGFICGRKSELLYESFDLFVAHGRASFLVMAAKFNVTL